MLEIMAVQQLPLMESFNSRVSFSRVSFEFRQGVFFSCKGVDAIACDGKIVRIACLKIVNNCFEYKH